MPAKQVPKRRPATNGAGSTEVMPGIGPPARVVAASGPVVHNVNLSGGTTGQPVNLLELLLEQEGGQQAGQQPTRLMEPAARPPVPGRGAADLTVPMAAAVPGRRPQPSEFTAIVQSFQPMGSDAAKVSTATGPMPSRASYGGARAGEYTALLEGLLDTPPAKREPRAAPETQVMNLGAATESTPLSGANPAPASPADVQPATPPKPVVLAQPAAQAPPTTGGLPGWVPWLLVAIALELLAILLVLLVGLKR